MKNHEKIAINPSRLQWCLDASKISIADVSSSIHIAKRTIEQAMVKQAVLSVKQVEKLADYFKRSVLFFLDPTKIEEENIYSPQFRTINNQTPFIDTKLRALIENIEKQRQIYLGLLDDLGRLDEVSNKNWIPDFELNKNNIKQCSAMVRKWLQLSDNVSFDNLRQGVENKGIMVFVSNGYNGQYQIDKKSLIRGFSLYYDILPIIAIKKQSSKGAQAFTLMHELAHLLLHKESAIDENENFYSYQGKEKEANVFSSNVLMPDNMLKKIDVTNLLNRDVVEYDDYLDSFKKQCCISGDAILYRLRIESKITQTDYQKYKDFKQQQQKQKMEEESRQKELGTMPVVPRKYRHKEPINMFGRKYVATVLDAKANNNITLYKASTYLDNLKIDSLHKLENNFV